MDHAPTAKVTRAADPALAALRTANGKTVREVMALAVKAYEARNMQEAADLFGVILRAAPQHMNALNNLGVCLRKLGKLEGALACYRRVLKHDPDNRSGLVNLGNVLRDLGRFEEAGEAYAAAAKANPDSPEGAFNQGLTLRDRHRLDEALEAIERALALQPDDVDMNWDRTLTLLQMGRMAEGFAGYHWRWGLEQAGKRPNLAPLWSGTEDLTDKTLWIHGEQGIGDQIQFLRYLPLARTRAGRVVLSVRDELLPLLRPMAGTKTLGADTVVGIRQGPKNAAYQVAMLDLPAALGTGETIPRPEMLSVPEGPVMLPPAPGGGKLKVGLVHGGSPGHRNDRNRSMGAAALMPLLDLPDVAFYSLQVGTAAGDLRHAGAQGVVVDLGPSLKDFRVTARVLLALDLLITVDTSVAHLAGTLGRPCWIMIPQSCDWRWRSGTDRSPWYDSVTLLRQERQGHWAPVIARAKTGLERWLETGQPVRP